MQSPILKECYSLAAEYEESDIVRNILKNKKSQLLDGQNDLEQIIPSDLFDAVSVSRIFEKLSQPNGLDNDTYKASLGFLMLEPESAEKEYLTALLNLSTGTDEKHRLEAWKHINSAWLAEPNDPRYIALIKVLQEIDG
jgi:hypothetical protein